MKISHTHNPRNSQGKVALSMPSERGSVSRSDIQFSQVIEFIHAFCFGAACCGSQTRAPGGTGVSPVRTELHGRDASATTKIPTIRHFSPKRNSALTLIEVLMVLAVLLFLAAFVISTMTGPLSQARTRSSRIQCVNNLKQVGLAFRVWEGDNNDKFPMVISETNGGEMELFNSTNAWRQFLVMSNELATPKVLFCPSETDRARTMADYFGQVRGGPIPSWNPFLGNSNISYFVGLVTNDVNPQMILSGDHNLTNGTPIKSGILQLTTSRSSGWTAEMHHKVGNIALADGSVQQLTNANVQATVRNSAGADTNYLLMPILNP